MKTLFVKFLSISLTLLLFMSSCSKKDEISDSTSDNLKSSDLVYGIDIPLADLTQNVDQLILNPNDAQDEKINKYLYYLSSSLVDLVKDGSFNHAVIDLALQSPNQTANLVTLANSYPAYKTAINQKLSSKSLTFDQIAADLTYTKDNITETYVPCIFIPNLEIIDQDKQPIFSPSIEVDCSNNEAIEDNVAAWYFTIDGVLKSVMLSEEDSKITTNPIFLLDNGELNPIGNDFKIMPPDEGLKSTLTTTSFHSYEYRINMHYEPAPGRSEFTEVAYRIDPQGVTHWIYNSGGWKEIDKVKRSEVGTDMLKWTSHCGNYTPYNQNYVFWNTYERDWNRSPKSLGSATANGTTIYLTGRFKNSSEWYTFDPANPLVRTDLSYIYANWAKWYNNTEKSKLRIWRVEQ